MLQITIPSVELYDDLKDEFIITKEQTLQLEHSLVSLAKWESKWKKPFLINKEKTFLESIDYIRCMTITQNVLDINYNYITDEIIKEVTKYIEDPMTATTFSKNETQKISREVITAEIIYYWMVTFTIPFECQKWHLNRLLTLINVCNIKNQPQKKIGKKELNDRNSQLNAIRKSQLNTTG